MQTSQVTVRRAAESDYDEWFALFAAVAAEGRWLGSELPLDQAAYRRRYLDALVDPDRPGIPFVAEAGGRHVGQLFLTIRAGIGDIGMAVDAAWRGQGVGSALLAAAVEWARAHDLHKLALQVWPHNVAAQRLYEKFGFVAEGRLRRQYRRRNGELWDAVVMGLVLDETSPGSPEPG